MRVSNGCRGHSDIKPYSKPNSFVKNSFVKTSLVKKEHEQDEVQDEVKANTRETKVRSKLLNAAAQLERDCGVPCALTEADLDWFFSPLFNEREGPAQIKIRTRVEQAFFNMAYYRLSFEEFLQAKLKDAFTRSFPGTVDRELDRELVDWNVTDPLYNMDYNGKLYYAMEYPGAQWLDAEQATGRGCLDLARKLVGNAQSITHVALSNCDTLEVLAQLQKLLTNEGKHVRWTHVYLETSKFHREYAFLPQVFEFLSSVPELKVLRWVCHNNPENHPHPDNRQNPGVYYWSVPMHSTFRLAVNMMRCGVDVQVVTTFRPNDVELSPRVITTTTTTTLFIADDEPLAQS
jgi:hypothetical protein